MMAFYTTDREKVTFGEDLVGAIISPVQTVFTSVSNGIGGFFGYFGDVNKLRTDNEAMSVKIDELENSVRRMEEFKIENERLKNMLDLKQTALNFDMVAAIVIAKDPGNWFNSFTIDKGTADGLKVKQAVITTKGLVGYIYEIGTSWAKVYTILDANSSVGALVSRTRDIAVVDGDTELANDGFCKMTYIAKGASVMVGDLIETSGLGGMYPKGILIGKIREIRPETHGISQYAVIETAVDFERISEVFVITQQ